MDHPKDRRERRAVRDVVIARRKFIVTQIWGQDSYSKSSDFQRKWIAEMEWGKYAKFNLNCGCMMCHSPKYLSAKRKRRLALKFSESQAEFRHNDNAIKY
jgi:hypothetical protein